MGEKLLGGPMKTLQRSDVLLIGISDATTLQTLDGARRTHLGSGKREKDVALLLKRDGHPLPFARNRVEPSIFRESDGITQDANAGRRRSDKSFRFLSSRAGAILGLIPIAG